MKTVKVPELSESVSEAVLLEWRKAPGDAVREGEALTSVETDKIVMEVYAPCDGVLQSIAKQAGDAVAAGDILGEIDDSVELPADKPAAASPPKTPHPPAVETSAASAAVARSAADEQSPAAMPSAKKIAAEQGVDLRSVAGSGKGGRITKGDVLAASAGGGGRERREPMTKLRARIAERLLQSQRETATLTTFNEVNMRAIIDLRAECRETFEQAHGVKLGIMSFFVKAAAAALQKFPIINASIDGGDVVYHEYYDIGVAVGAPRGLVVPILRGADAMTMAGIEKTIADFGARAKTGALTPDEISGGTFTITNGGVFGSMLSTPILNPPQSAILGVHAATPRPIAENGEIVIRPMCYLALSYDHRIIDGREAVLFLVAVKNALENPARMLLDI